MRLTWKQRWNLWIGSDWHIWWVAWHLTRMNEVKTKSEIDYHYKKVKYHIDKI